MKVSKRTRKSKQQSSSAAPAPVLTNRTLTDWWSRGMSFVSLLVSLVAIVVSVITAQWGSAYFYAAPSELSYAYTQSNVPANGDQPPSSNTTIAVYNSASTPARNVRVLLRPITVDPVINCDQVNTVHNAPWGAVAIDIDRIPAEGSAKITVFEETDKFPPSLEPWSGLKYQYAAKVDSVETEFGSVRCDYNRCAVFFVPKPDDSNEPYVKHPSGLKLEAINKERYPDARLLTVPPDADIQVYDQRPTPVSPPP